MRARKKLESVLSPEGDMSDLELSDIIDVKAVQPLIDDFYELSRIPLIILDLKGRKVLSSKGWQEICTKFHRVHAETRRNCAENDSQFTAGVPPGEAGLYKCKNNMWDMVTRITIDGCHIGNVLSGQFFLDDETLDYELFRSQARRYGFDEEEYIRALEAVPRLSRRSVEKSMPFLLKFAQILSQLGYSNLKLSRSLARLDYEKKAAENQRASHLRFFEDMDRINRAMQGTTDLDHMMRDTLDAALSIFDCDRAYLAYPCDPEASSWQVRMERARPDWPGVSALEADVPMTSDIAEAFGVIRASRGPVRFDPGSEFPLRAEESKRFGVQSRLAMALYPLGGDPWIFGLHQCSYGRVWTNEEEKVFREIGRRLTDSLSALLTYRDLKESEERLRLALDAAEVVAWEVNAVTGEHYEAGPVDRLFGRSKGFKHPELEDLAGSIHPDDREYVMGSIAKALRGECDYNVEYRIVCPDGDIRWITANGSLQYDGDGVPVRLLGIARDITERRETLQSLAAREREYKTLIENIPDLIVRYDSEFRRVYVNPAWERTTGLSAEQVVSKRASDARVVSKPVASQYFDDVRRVFETGGQQMGVFSWVNALRETVNVEYTMVPERDLQGKITTVLSVGCNITTLKHTEARLRESEERYRHLVEHSPDAIYIHKEGRFVFTNAAGANLLGAKEPEELYGRHALDFIPPGCREAIQRRIENAWSLGKNPLMEQKLIRLNGSEVQVEMVSTYFPHEGAKSVLAIARDVTERSRAEKAVREHEKKLDDVVNTARDAIIMIDGAGRISLWNNSAAEIFGYSLDEVLGRHLHRLLAPPRLMEAYEKGFATFKTSGAGPVVGRVTELTAMRKDGSEMPVEVSLSSIRVGHEWHAVGVVRDITDRKRADEELRELSQMMRLVLDNMPSFVFWKNLNGVYLGCNRLFAAIAGLSSSEKIVGLTDLDLPWKHEEAESYRADDLTVTSTGIPKINYEETLRGADGRTAWLRTSKVPLKNLAGDVVGVLGTFEDITDRKRTEEAFLESEGKCRTLVEGSLVGVYIIQDDLVRFVNKRWCDITGYSYDEVVDKANPLDFVHPDDKELMKENVRKRLAGDVDKIEYTLRGITKDGRQNIVKVFGKRLTYHGKPAIMGTLVDITAEKKLEDRLMQSQKMEAIGTLAGGIAHDFNNILTVLGGYGHLLRMNIAATDPLRIYADRIISACENATNLTTGLLTFTRQKPVILGPVDINSVIKKTEGLLRRLLREDILFDVELCHEEAVIMGDPTQISQVLFNLAANARDAIPDAGKLTIQTRLIDMDSEACLLHDIPAPGRYVLMSVSDTGVGMDKETKQRIFEPFFTTKDVGKGTGLGLATAYGIVQQHNGHISVYTEPNLGTTFHIYLPLARSASATERRATAIPEKPARGTETILVAEDDQQVRKLIVNVLAGHGYKVIEVADGDEVVRTYRSLADSIDMTILDSVMPHKNGRQAYEEICEIDPNAKALFMSGYTKDTTLEKDIASRGVEFIAKPLMPVDLLKKVREMLDG